MTDPFNPTEDTTPPAEQADLPPDFASGSDTPPDTSDEVDLTATSFDLGQPAPDAAPISLDLPPLPDLPGLAPVPPESSWPLGDQTPAAPTTPPASVPPTPPASVPPAPPSAASFPPPPTPSYDVYQPQPQASAYGQQQTPYASAPYAQTPYTQATPGQQPYAPYGQPNAQPYQQAYYQMTRNIDPNRPGTPDSTTWACAAHWAAILTGFIAPLIIMLTKGNEDAYVRAQAAEALNFQITVTIAAMASGILCLAFIGFIMLPIVSILNIVFCIMGALAANRGEPYRYPINIRMVK